MFGLGITEVAVIIAIVVLLFGPQLARRWGKGLAETIRESRKIKSEIVASLKEEDCDERNM